MEKLILRRIDRNNEEMLLNFGPQHPSTHGVLNFLVETDGEVMKKAIPDIGYLHRSLEKIGEMVGYPGFMPYTDRIDYVAAMFANEGYALAVERLLKIEAPPGPSTSGPSPASCAASPATWSRWAPWPPTSAR